MAKVLDFINVKWWNNGDETKRDEYRSKYKEKEEIEQSRKESQKMIAPLLQPVKNDVNEQILIKEKDDG